MASAQSVSHASPPVISIVPDVDNVIKQTKTRRKDRKKSHPDAKLIDLCIEAVTHLAAANTSLAADPSGSDDFGHYWADLFFSRARRAISQAAEIKCQTIDGLASKAAVLKALELDIANLGLVDEELEFVMSLTRDIVAVHRASQSHLKNTNVVPRAKC